MTKVKNTKEMELTTNGRKKNEDTTKWYDCPHCDAGYTDQECICEENEE